VYYLRRRRGGSVGSTPNSPVVCARYLRALVHLYGVAVGHGWLVKPHPFF